MPSNIIPDTRCSNKDRSRLVIKDGITFTLDEYSSEDDDFWNDEEALDINTDVESMFKKLDVDKATEYIMKDFVVLNEYLAENPEIQQKLQVLIRFIYIIATESFHSNLIFLTCRYHLCNYPANTRILIKICHEKIPKMGR